MKKTVSLCDSWLFSPRFDGKCFQPDYDWGSFRPAELPHNNTELPIGYFDAKCNQFVSTYTRILVLPEKYNGCRFLLRFEGALSYAEVYVNGQFVTSHKGDTPFTADITAPVRFDYENRIVVKVDSRVKKEVPSSGVNGPMISYGGLFRDVSLCVCCGAVIDDVYVTTSNELSDEKGLTVAVRLGDFYPDSLVEADVCDGGGTVVGSLTAKAVLADTLTLKGVILNAALWSSENPAQYTVRIRLKRGNEILDCCEAVFGFRTAEFKRDGFYLNGKKTKLVGLNRLDCYPYVGKAMPASQQAADARILKYELGCNVVRTHGLASRDFISECSRIGLMVISDISGDGYVGDGDWRDALVKNVADMVLRDRNQPAVIAWGVRVNNSRDCDELYFKTGKAARDLDYRATLGARNFMGSHMYEDVFAFNDYPEGRTLSKLGKTCKLFVPYIVSEHTGRSFPVKNYDTEPRRLEHALRHLSVIDKVLKSRRISGAVGMSMSDFNSALHKGSGDSIDHYGVTDMFRNPKLAAYAYASQDERGDVLEVSSTLCPDEFSGVWIFTNCEFVKLYRGDDYVGTYYPDRKRFPHLPHPPIIAGDLVGELAASVEGMNKYQARVFKKLLGKVERRGLLNLRLIDKIVSKLLMRSLKMSFSDYQKLLGKYASDSSEPRLYRAEGWKGGSVAVEKTFGNAGGSRLSVRCDAERLVITKSYEAACIRLEATDIAGQRLWYDFTPYEVRVVGPLRLIGPSRLSLEGGVGGFYVVSCGFGTGVVRIVSKWGETVKEIEVVKGETETL